MTDARTGEMRRITPRTADALAPRPEACVFSPDGRQIAFVRRLTGDGVTANQIFVANRRD